MDNKKNTKPNGAKLDKTKANNTNDVEEILLNLEAYLSKPTVCTCGGLFVYKGLGVYICKECNEVFKNEYAKVRDFVDEYGTEYNILEIAEKTGVKKHLIDIFIKQGKFETVKTQKRCRLCREPISKGIYCNKCALRQIQDQMDEEHKKKIIGSIRSGDMKGQMHFISKGK